jgi:hypothetical protein
MPDGKRWLRLHLATVRQQLDLADMQPIASNDSDGLRKRYGDWLDMLEAARNETSWGGNVGDGVALGELQVLVERWLMATEEAAIPLASESDSDTISAEPLSAEQTAERKQSGGRRSHRS